MLYSIRSALGFTCRRALNAMRPPHTTFNRATISQVRHNMMTKDELTMDNIYREWTVQDDETLYTNRHLSTVKLASLLGRGLHGVESRIKKLSDVNSPAYSRLFGASSLHHSTAAEEEKSKGLTPVKEILRRIQWDPTLNGNEFTIVHYDRVDNSVCETNFNAENDSISGKERQYVFALPEHRIQSVKYRERVVWDKEMRMDCVFGSMNGKGETIDRVIETYDEWKREKEEREEVNRKRYVEMVEEITDILGEDGVREMKSMTSALLEREVDVISVRDYVKSIIGLYYDANRGDVDADESLDATDEEEEKDEDDLDSSDQAPIIHFLYVFSELVVLLPNELWREAILAEVETVLKSREGDSNSSSSDSTGRLPELKEDELEEKFVRGSGAGGQKINKTSNKVILLHIPTQLRVECQDTRSLQQNRKIARKRLQLKLDDLINGESSRSNKKASKIGAKKSKNKARNKRRQLKKLKREVEAEDSKYNG
ncbi:hypothetical protein ACHAWO_004464 [Cyclotella atomus]|uniref:Prokaryotic-type class I peptide chain release factors domain-containing protein n=1 Tax=Cyclotella atomus TaxID=382360 RepID=A0ABD3NZ46_9STRA